MVVDLNPYASSWANGHFSLYWVPTSYFDGGQRVIVGANTEQDFRDSIETVGAREVVPLNLSVSFEWLGTGVISIHVELSQFQVNAAPDAPSVPGGDGVAVTNRVETYTAVTTDPNDDPVYYMWDFDGEMTEWLGPYASGEEVEIEHTWFGPVTVEVRVKAKDDGDLETAWSPPLTVDVALCGDADGSGGVDIDDAVYLIMYIFADGPAPDPIETGDADCSGGVDIDDVVYIISYIFTGGPYPCSSGC